MHITLIDDSIPFDAFSPGSRPLGGAEKAFASLPGALAKRGHEVHVYNRTPYGMIAEEAQWETLTADFPSHTDALIAFRKPSLLTSVRQAEHRLLWATAAGRQLEPARKALKSLEAGIVFLGETQRESWDDRGDVPLKVIAPGLRPDYLEETPCTPAAQPVALVTTHPAHGLDWLLDLWTGRVLPAVPGARLLVVSAVLEKAKAGGEVPAEMQALFAKASAVPGLEVIPPRHDVGMAQLYRLARVHLYPGHPDDMVCWTLMESQACGLPAVVRPLGAVRERLRDGQTGHVAPDDEAFANLAVRLLSDEDAFWSMNRDAHLLQRDRNWDVVAAEFEAVLNPAD
jgi:glycosyltransferase involved in cell wall biosynthesis